MKKRVVLRAVRSINPGAAALVAGLFLMAGAIALQATHADTGGVSSEAENGTIAGNAQKFTGIAGASGGGIVTFKSGGGGGGGGGDGVCAPPTKLDGCQPGPNDLYTATDGSTNYFRSLIPANPKLDPNSSSIVGSIGGNTPKLNGPDWQITIYTSSNSDPEYNPSFSQSSWGCSVGGSIHIPDYATREVPSPGDEWVVVYNKDDKTIKSIWGASKSGGKWNGSCGGTWPASGGGGTDSKKEGVGTGAEVQASAGFILNSEVASGAINHALYFTSTNSCGSFRAPAGKSDGNGGGSSCAPMGARIQLDPSVDCNGIGGSAGEKMICVTMQKYGGYILDSGGPGPISGIGVAGDDMTDPSRSPWQKPGNGMRSGGVFDKVGLGPDGLDAIPWNKLRVLSSWNGQ